MADNRVQLVVNGASGRMGRLVCETLFSPEFEDRFRLVAPVAHTGSASLGKPCLVADHSDVPLIQEDFTGPCDVVIDFSTPEGTAHALEMALNSRAALLVAVTGFSETQRKQIESAAETVPVLIAPNTSVGVNVVSALVEQAVRRLGAGSRVEIIESHHRHIKDAPSGTALMLGEAVRRAGASMTSDQFHSLRGGGVIGEHTVRIFSHDDYLEIRHVATSRRLFAAGALRAALWLAKRKSSPGLYSMDDVTAT